MCVFLESVGIFVLEFCVAHLLFVAWSCIWPNMSEVLFKIGGYEFLYLHAGGKTGPCDLTRCSRGDGR